MSAETTQREPTMEEILSSIRKIISDEDDNGEVMPLKPEGSPAAVELDDEDDDMAAAFEELAEREEIAVEADEDDADLVFMDKEGEAVAEFEMEVESDPEPAHEPQSKPIFSQEPILSAPIPDDRLIADQTASQAAGALGRLMGSMNVSSGQTLEGIVRSMLNPMLKEWLDSNLPRIVEAEVQKEIERIRRMAS